MRDAVRAATANLVLAAIQSEADLDGLSTASQPRLGEITGLSATAALNAIHQLADEGRIQIVGRHEGRGGPLMIQLPEPG